jgi:hypothetical protein
MSISMDMKPIETDQVISVLERVVPYIYYEEDIGVLS